ncbi:MAG: dTDP-glucose 4,6-dehydratase [Deltaproteobacteria bacterium]|nr:dTDP-glucose 4,6-dehydratase [Deltaproteobacteria bacterium]
MVILITGGCGFIGSNFIRVILQAREDVEVINVDKLTYAGNLANLLDVKGHFSTRYRFIKGDIADKDFVKEVFEKFDPDWIVHFAAESHVDRSILEPEDFIRTNIYGTYNLLEFSRMSWPLEDSRSLAKKRFLQISTDEVYGSLGETGLFTEKSPYDPSSPYSASKAASDHLAKAYFRTYALPVIITNSSNNYGPYQFPEKLIPLTITNARKGVELPVYGDGKNVRDWLFVEDHCSALLCVLDKGIPGECYNIGGHCEKENIEVVHTICDLLDERLGRTEGRPRRDLIKFVTDRPGHDRRYAIDPSKIKKLGWQPRVSFEEGIRTTIEWLLENTPWVENILNGTYRDYYKKQYGESVNGHP